MAKCEDGDVNPAWLIDSNNTYVATLSMKHRTRKMTKVSDQETGTGITCINFANKLLITCDNCNNTCRKLSLKNC